MHWVIANHSRQNRFYTECHFLEVYQQKKTCWVQFVYTNKTFWCCLLSNPPQSCFCLSLTCLSCIFDEVKALAPKIWMHPSCIKIDKSLRLRDHCSTIKTDCVLWNEIWCWERWKVHYQHRAKTPRSLKKMCNLWILHVILFLVILVLVTDLSSVSLKTQTGKSTAQSVACKCNN